MIFTAPSKKRGMVSISRLESDADKPKLLQKEVVQILVKSIQNTTSPQNSISAQLYTDQADEDLTLIAIRDTNKQRSNEILLGIFQ